MRHKSHIDADNHTYQSLSVASVAIQRTTQTFPHRKDYFMASDNVQSPEFAGAAHSAGQSRSWNASTPQDNETNVHGKERVSAKTNVCTPPAAAAVATTTSNSVMHRHTHARTYLSEHVLNNSLPLHLFSNHAMMHWRTGDNAMMIQQTDAWNTCARTHTNNNQVPMSSSQRAAPTNCTHTCASAVQRSQKEHCAHLCFPLRLLGHPARLH